VRWLAKWLVKLRVDPNNTSWYLEQWSRVNIIACLKGWWREEVKLACDPSHSPLHLPAPFFFHHSLTGRRPLHSLHRPPSTTRPDLVAIFSFFITPPSPTALPMPPPPPLSLYVRWWQIPKEPWNSNLGAPPQPLMTTRDQQRSGASTAASHRPPLRALLSLHWHYPTESESLTSFVWQNHLKNEGFVSQDHIGGFLTKRECANTHK
jgi:hypothetical protein